MIKKIKKIFNLIKKQAPRAIVHSQNNFLNIKINPLTCGQLLLEVDSKSSLIGVISVNIYMQQSQESIFETESGRAKIIFSFPVSTAMIFIRNASQFSVPNDLKVINKDIIKYDSSKIDSRIISNMSKKFEKFFFIHTIGKTGSVALQDFIYSQSQAKFFVFRAHWLNGSNLYTKKLNKSYLNLINTRPNTFQKSILDSFNLIREVNKPKYVLCGVRNPVDIAIASVFQNQGQTFINSKLKSKDVFRIIKERINERLNFQEMWWKLDFMALYGINLNSFNNIIQQNNYFTLEIDNNNPAKYKGKIYFYRIEDGNIGIKSIIQSILDNEFIDNIEVPKSNHSDNKVYKNLYHSVKDDFKKYKHDYSCHKTLYKIYSNFGYDL